MQAHAKIVKRDKAVVIGGGIGGSVVALELSNYFDRVVLIEKNAIMNRTSVLNPGRILHGFHYTHYATCKEMLIGSLLFEDYFPNHRRNTDSGWYLVVKNSQVCAEDYLNVCKFIKEVYSNIRGDFKTDFGDPDDFYSLLSEADYGPYVDKEKIALAVKTHEYNIDLEKLSKTIQARLREKSNIDIKEYSEVFNAKEKADEYVVYYRDENQAIHIEQCSIVVNATWEHRHSIDQLVGALPKDEFTNRLKVLALVDLPPMLKSVPSIGFIRGPFGMFSNIGNGQGLLSYAPITNCDSSHSVNIPDDWEKEITYNDSLTVEMQELGEKIIAGVSQFIPAMKNAKLVELRKGVVQAPGDGDIYHPQSAIHRRNQSGIKCIKPGWYSFDTGKLMLAPLHAKTLINLLLFPDKEL